MNARALIAAQLESAGIVVGEEELDALASGWATRRAALDRLYAINEARYEEASITFTALTADYT